MFKNKSAMMMASLAVFIGCSMESHIHKYNQHLKTPYYLSQTDQNSTDATESAEIRPQTTNDASIDLIIAAFNERKSAFEAITANPVETLEKTFNISANPSNTTDTFNIEDILSKVVRDNPLIKSKIQALQGVLNRYNQVFEQSRLLAEYATYKRELSLGIAKDDYSDSIIMHYPFPTMLSLKGHIVENQVNIAFNDLLITTKQQLKKVKQAYYRYNLLEKQTLIYQEFIEWLSLFLDSVKASYKTGKAPYTNILQTSSMLDEQETKLSNLGYERNALMAIIQRAMNMGQERSTTIIGSFELHKGSMTIQNLEKRGLSSRQELKMISLEILNMAMMIEMAEQQYLPKESLGFSYFSNNIASQTGYDKSKQPFQDAMLPMQNEKIAIGEAYIEEMRLNLKKMQDKYTSEQNMTIEMINQYATQLQKAQESFSLMKEELLPKAEEAFDAVMSGYKTSVLPFQDALAIIKNYITYQVQFETFKADLWIYTAELENIIGEPLYR